MSLRAFILRTILILLALTAATAVIGIFIPGTTFIWRLVGTGAIGIALGGVGLRFAAQVDAPTTRLAGLAGLLGCAAIGLVASLFTMGVLDLLVPGADMEWWFTLLLLIGVAAMTVGALRLGGASERAASVSLIVVTALALAIGLFAIWGAQASWDLLEHSLWLFWTVCWFGTLLSLSLVGLRRPGRSMPLVASAIRWTGVVAASVGGIYLGAVSPYLRDVDVPVFALVANAIAAPVALWCLLELCRVSARFTWLPVLTVVAATIAMASIAVAVWLDDGSPLWGRLIAAASIVAVCGIFATLVVSRVARSIAPPTRVAELGDEIDLRCPLCGLSQKLPLRVGNTPPEPGAAVPTCSRCGLELVIVATVPKCATCEHILLWAAATNCPECGAERGTRAETQPAPAG